MFRFLKNRENSVFGTKIVPTTSELNLTGSTYYSSAITMYRTILALFSVSKFFNISKIAICGGGGSKYRYFDPKNRLLTVFFTEKRYRSNNIGYISKIISNTIPLRVCSLSELRCLTRIFAVQ